MKDYLFSILTRGFVAISGFLVFLTTAKIFGPDGRGVIAYGTSLFAALAIALSLNLGCVFLGRTFKNEALKKLLVPDFLVINFTITALTATVGLSFWCLSKSAQSMLSLSQALGFSLMSIPTVWFHNGHPFFSSFSQTKLQDKIIFSVRFVLIIFLLIFLIIGSKDLSFFIWSYTALLSVGTAVEIFVLLKANSIRLSFRRNFTHLKMILYRSWWPYLDHMSFTIFPLLIMILSANYLTKANLGKTNFAIQIVSLIFLLATAANRRITMYVANVGIVKKLYQFRRLLWVTLTVSVVAIPLLYIGIDIITQTEVLSLFLGTGKLFLFAALSIPGYLSYQFLNPIWIELNQLKKSAIINLMSAIFCLSVLPIATTRWGESGLIFIFSFFHILVFIGNLSMYSVFLKSYVKSSPKNLAPELSRFLEI